MFSFATLNQFHLYTEKVGRDNCMGHLHVKKDMGLFPDDGWAWCILYTVICQTHKEVPGLPPLEAENICTIQTQVTQFDHAFSKTEK